MIKLLSDENFDADILRGLRLRVPELEVVSVHDVGLTRTPDPLILARAANEGRVLLTHDRQTVPGFEFNRVRAGKPMPGLFLVSDQMQKGQAIDQSTLALECLRAQDCTDLVVYFPL